MNLVVSLYVDSYQNDTKNRENFKHISWSPYDRITMRKATSFEDLCAYDTNPSKMWNGVEQKMHLIGENENCNWEIINKDDKDDKIIIKTPLKEYNYYCIISLKLDYRLLYLFEKNEVNKKDLFESIDTTFKKSLDSNSNAVTYENFKSLGAEDLVIILLSDSITEIIKSVSTIKGLQCTIEESDVSKNIDIFSSVCTFVGPNKNEIDSLIDTDMIIRFNLKSDNADEFLADIKKESYFKDNIFSYEKIFCGKAAIQLKISKNTLPFSVFGEKGIFNESNTEIYTKYVNSSRTYFVNDTSDNQKHNCYECNNNSFKPKDIIPDFNDETDSFSSENKVAKFIDREYKRLLTTPRYYIWHKILIDQWTAMKSFSEYYQKNDKTLHCEFLNALQVALLHINQACSPVSETPYHNYFYAGSYNDLLMMYYGIISSLFNMADSLPHADGTEQHKRKFAICFESTAKIHSTLYTKNTPNMDGTDKQERFVVFYLPYDNFWNYSDNIKYLIHEVFHYVAPYDRKYRSEQIINIIFKKILYNFLCVISDEIPEFKNNINLTKDVFTFLLNLYTSGSKTKSLYETLFREEPEFFLLPNPEWDTVYYINNKIEIIVDDVSLFVKDILKENFEEAVINSNYFNGESYELKKYIEKLNFIFSLDGLKNFKYVFSAIYKEVAENVLIYTKAAKEAFCDYWAVNILEMNVFEYIDWLFSTLNDELYEKAASDYWIKNSKTLSLYSFESRIWFILELFWGEQKTTHKNHSLKQLLKKNFKSKLSNFNKILYDLDIKYQEFITENAIEIDDMLRIAFHNLNTVFGNFTIHNELILNLRKAASQDLSNTDSFVDFFAVFLYVTDKTNDAAKQIKCSKHPEAPRKFFKQKNDIQGSYIANSLEDYIKYTREISIQHNNRNLWFRGLCNHKFKLLPSLFRHCDNSLSLYANQANILKYAYYLTPSFNDLWVLPIEQQMACLQHYGMATNLLDFSLDSLVSLHFALNPDNPDDKKALINGETKPVVYVFDPINYSNAIFALKNGCLDSVLDYHISPVLMDINNNSSEKSLYFLGDMSFEFLVNHTKEFHHKYVPDTRTDPYPVPLIIKQTQPRIIAQNGTFVAFSLFSSPQNDGSYDYLDLLLIQNLYKTKFRVRDSALFLRPIYINQNAIIKIQSDLERLNIGISKYYPELSTIFQEGLKRYNKNEINGA